MGGHDKSSDRARLMWNPAHVESGQASASQHHGQCRRAVSSSPGATGVSASQKMANVTNQAFSLKSRH